MHRSIRAAALAAALAAFPAGARPDDAGPGAQGEEAWDAPVSAGDGIAVDGPALARSLAKPSARARRIVRLTRLDTDRLLAEDRARASRDDPDWKREHRVGVVRGMRRVAVPRSPARWGSRAETLDDGSRVFRVEVAAPGATGIRLRFRSCALPPGSEVTVSNAERPGEAYGPLRVPKDAAGWLAPTVFGPRAVLALRVPADSLGADVDLVLDGVAQRYRAADPDPADEHAGGFRAAGALSCIQSVACDDAYVATVARGVGRFEFSSGGSVYLCSGTLLSDLDTSTQTPWMLTANHCISTEKSAQSLEVFWDYRLGSCGGFAPGLFSVPRTLGATLVATTAASDASLLRITGSLPSNRYFCGWTTVRPAKDDDVTGVHHPQGSHMRLSRGAVTSSNANFHTVVWDNGVTAEGSSGSAIFNASMQVIGQLCCGESYCTVPNGPDEYGRFDVSYPRILEDSLGQETTPAGPDAWDPGDDTSAGATQLGTPTEAGTSHGPHRLHGSDAADWFAFDLEAGVPYRFESDGAVRADLFADAAGTQTVAEAAGSPSGFATTAVPSATATHWLRIARATAGVDANYDLRSSRQDTTPPKSVGRLVARASKKGLVTISWRDRARGEMGYRVEFLGPGGWVRVANLPANSKSFRHRPGPGSQLYRVGPYDAVTSNYREVHVRVKGRGGLDAWDPADDTGAGASILPAADGLTDVHELNRNDFADWFAIDLAAGERWSFETESDGDTIGFLYTDPGGILRVATSDDQGAVGGEVTDFDFRIDYVAPASGTYWLQVRAFPSTPRATYRLRVRRE